MLISLGCIRLNCEDIPVDAGWEIPLEVWYRATDGYRGQEFDTSTLDVVSFAPPNSWQLRKQATVRDAVPRDGVFALVIYVHGAMDSRFSGGFLATRLASHGYVVVAADHIDDNEIVLPDDVYDLASLRDTRPRVVGHVTDQLMNGLTGVDIELVTSRVGLTGVSSGSWTTLMMLQLVDDVATG